MSIASRATLACLVLAFTVAAAQKRPVTVDDLGVQPLAHPVSPVWSPDERQFAYIDRNNLFVFDIRSQARREILPMKELEDAAAKIPEPELFDWTNRRVTEAPVQWFSTSDRLLVSAGGDLFLVSLKGATKPFEQLTHTALAEYDPKLSPDDRYVSFRRQHDLYALEIANKTTTRLTENGSETLLNAQLDWVYPEELDLGTAHWWSPDSKHIAYLQLDTHAEPIFPQVSLLAPDGKLEPERFPKPGDPNADARVGVVGVNGGPTTWMSLGEPKDRLLARVTWLPDSSAVAVMRLNRIQNQLDLLRADIASGRAETLIHEEDPFWINVKDEPWFFKDGKEFLWESERDGYRHLYLFTVQGRLEGQITQGDWVLDKLFGVDESKRVAYYTSNEGSPVESHLYRVDLQSRQRTRVTQGAGTHSVSVSSTGAYFTDRYSNLTTPPMQTIRDREGQTAMVWMPLDDTVPDTLALSRPEIVQVPGPDGVTFYARLIKPLPFDPAKKYPVIVQVYGGPGAQAVHDAWTGANMEQVYASHGFVVWQVDNRGSAGRGHKWESVLFHDMGAHELKDQKIGIEFLKKLPFVDASRIGITGWSYGGYMTLYSLMNAPELFRAGLSGAPVTDWRNYDSIYTERYMGLPDADQEGYKRSSPQINAANLKAKLLIVHNIEDDNVHFANTMQMAAALERANKQFRMVIYPQKAHGVSREYSKSLNSTMLAFFEENLK